MMSREDFADLLVRAVREGWISAEEAMDLMADFEAGDLDLALLPLPLRTAILGEDDEPLVGYLSRRVLLERPGRDAMQILFSERAREIAPLAASDVTAWQREMRQLIRDHMLEQARAGKGSGLTLTELESVTTRLQTEFAYLSRFADEISVKALEGKPLSEKQIGARSELYSGAGRAEAFRMTEAGYKDGYVVDYISQDDPAVCDPCVAAEQAGPYLPGAGVFPGDACNGRGHCRCIRVPRYAPAEAERLRGQVQQ